MPTKDEIYQADFVLQAVDQLLTAIRTRRPELTGQRFAGIVISLLNPETAEVTVHLADDPTAPITLGWETTLPERRLDRRKPRD